MEEVVNLEIRIALCHGVEFIFVGGDGLAVRVKQRDARLFSFVLRLLEELDGRVYQVRSDGNVYSPAAGVTTPFAAVVRFEPDQSRTVNNAATFQQFQEQLDAMLPSTNVVCAFRVTGRFQQMKTRSVPAQTKPYAPLIEASRRQSVFELGQCRGTLVGFRLPGFVKGINVPGYHVHFLTADRKAGGHVLDFMLEGGVLELAICSRINLLLPTDATALKDIDFSRDRAHELEKVEK